MRMRAQPAPLHCPAMTTSAFPPPCVPLDGLDAALQSQGFALIAAADVRRWLPADAAELVALPVWSRLLTRVGEAVCALRGTQPWFVEAHPFRIDTTDGIGRPTPEGAHRDGVDLVAVFMLGRHRIKGGESRVF